MKGSTAEDADRREMKTLAKRAGWGRPVTVAAAAARPTLAGCAGLSLPIKGGK